MASNPPTQSKAVEHSPWQLLSAFVGILILAQALIGALSLSALNHQVKENTADRIELKAQQTVDQIQAGLILGKPLDQYFGLDSLLSQLLQDASGVMAVEVRNIRQQPVLRIDADARTSDIMKKPALTIERPLLGPHEQQYGTLVLYADDGLDDAHALYRSNGLVLLAVTAFAALLMWMVLRWQIRHNDRYTTRRQQQVMPVLILFLAQLAYAGYAIYSFQTAWLSVSQENAQTLAQGVKRDLDKVLSYGLKPETLRGTKAYLERVTQSFPLIQEIQLQSKTGALLLSTATTSTAIDTADVRLDLA